jgi:Ca2+-transporting ATPase
MHDPRGDAPDLPGDAGLSAERARALLLQHGPNQIERQRPVPWWSSLLAQFKSPLIALLAGACVVAAALGETVDAIAILTIVVVNGAVGFLQEQHAERALQALRALTSPRARVVRDGRAREVASEAVVPGDLLLLDAGDVVAGDARVLEAHALLANESALTGESFPVEKHARPARAPDAGDPVADRVFMGTSIVAGSARARVVSTGSATELGKIARLLSTATRESTPLQVRLAGLSRILLLACLAIVAAVAALGVLHGSPTLDVLLSALSLAVAAVPEGLPAVVTIALAIGVRRMAKRNVLVRRLLAVETLGGATVICTDKTGTLTTGVMSVREVWSEDVDRALDAAAACCDAELDPEERGGVGDPTEVALLLAAAERGIRRADIERARPRVVVHPFDSERKRMSIWRADGVLYVKGAPESVLPRCDALGEGAPAALAAMTARGLRTLAIATGGVDREERLALLGLIGMADPPRSEAVAAVAAARAAGIELVMITGDHRDTARAIARELGILEAGQDPRGVVHARTSPADKLAIVRDWKQRGAVVAMTGDGVNDAPALREAHIGISMGKAGTEVAREASDVVLADDNFASIVAGVREGRGIFDNVQKTLVYLVAGNAGELALMLLAAAIGLPLPLLPLHLLWINLVTDGLPALALVTEPVDDAVMQRPPLGTRDPLLGRREWSLIARSAAVEAGVTLGTFAWALGTRGLLDARSLAFAVLVACEMLRAFAARSATRLLFEIGAFTNARLLAVVVIQLALQIAIHQLPATQRLFRISALSAADWCIVFALALIPVSTLELGKWVARRARGTRAG